jgi:hypothetical protein
MPPECDCSIAAELDGAHRERGREKSDDPLAMAKRCWYRNTASSFIPTAASRSPTTHTRAARMGLPYLPAYLRSLLAGKHRDRLAR